VDKTLRRRRLFRRRQDQAPNAVLKDGHEQHEKKAAKSIVKTGFAAFREVSWQTTSRGEISF
jgi:hypothetical protein